MISLSVRLRQVCLNSLKRGLWEPPSQYLGISKLKEIWFRSQWDFPDPTGFCNWGINLIAPQTELIKRNSGEPVYWTPTLWALAVTRAAGREGQSRPPSAFVSSLAATPRNNQSPTSLTPPMPRGGCAPRRAVPLRLTSPPGLTSHAVRDCDQPDSPGTGGGGWGVLLRAEVQEAG